LRLDPQLAHGKWQPVDNFDSRRSDTQGKTTDQERLICRHRWRPMRMANSQQPEQPKAKGREFAIAQDPIWKKQDQEQKRFLRRSHGEDSRKPIAIRTNQGIKEQER